VATKLTAEEGSVTAHAGALKKELGLRDLVLTQIVFVVGGSWVGTAAKLGPSHLAYWLLALLLFYVPQAAVVIYLNKRMPLEGGLYQWAKFAFNTFAGFMVAWNLWLLAICVMAATGLIITTNLAYAIGESAAWMPENRWLVSVVTLALVAVMIAVSVRGLSLGKWVHNAGGFIMLATYGALIVLPFVSLARGDLKHYQPLAIAAPAMGLLGINIFSKLAVGALAGFEYVAILAGESRAPARNIGRSVLIAAPVIAVMFIMGTSSVLVFAGDPNKIDLIGPVPQTLSIGFRSFGAAGLIVSIVILLLAARTIALMSLFFAGTSRLPMVAGWDHLLPGWFSQLHRRWKTPVNSILFVGAITLLFALASLIGVGPQEAFQVADNAAGVFYGIAYLVMFAIPLVGLREIRAGVPLWVRIAAISGFLVTLLYIVLSTFPIVDVVNPYWFAAKIIAVTLIMNLIGVGVFVTGSRRAARNLHSA
jgi:glutamate:GABA antiporter